MKYFLYALYAAVLGVIAFLTREIVAYVLLGFILIALTRILDVLRDISRKLDRRTSSPADEPSQKEA